MVARILIILLFSFHSLIANATPPSIEGTWALSEKWTGYMGVALQIKGPKFKYWFTSDVHSDSSPPVMYPITGQVVTDGNKIKLIPDQKSANLYDREWNLVIVNNEICMLAELHMKEKPLPQDRLLYKLDSFNEKTPTMNRPSKPSPKNQSGIGAK